jgi:hypothetical protein
MGEWTEQELERIGNAEEVEIATTDPDGTLHPFVVIWVVRVDRDLYVRSFHGTGGAWFRQVQASPGGRIRVGELDLEVIFRAATPDDERTISDAYRTKYATSPYMESMVGSKAGDATMQLVPV